MSRVTYSADRRTVTIRSTYSPNPDWLEVTECRYDKTHRLVKETTSKTEKSDEGRLKKERTTTTYQYGDRVSIATSGKRKTYLYQDASGRIVRGMVRGPGKYSEGTEYTYFPDHFETLSEWSEIDVSGSERCVFDKYGNRTRLETAGLLETSIYEFDDVGNWTKRVAMFSGSGVSEGTGVVETRHIVYQEG